MTTKPMEAAGQALVAAQAAADEAHGALHKAKTAAFEAEGRLNVAMDEYRSAEKAWLKSL